jgi:hypothetical protein
MQFQVTMVAVLCMEYDDDDTIDRAAGVYTTAATRRQLKMVASQGSGAATYFSVFPG